MRLEIDKSSDALYFRLREQKIVDSEEVQPGVILDFDENNQVVGIEFLTVSKRATLQELSSLQFNAA
jgi:uncharacterized protein YuzE